jgi:WD40 repeat protein
LRTASASLTPIPAPSSNSIFTTPNQNWPAAHLLLILRAMFSLTKVLVGLSIFICSLSAAVLELESTTNQPIYFSYALSDDGRYIAGGTGKSRSTNSTEPVGQVVLWDGKTGRQLSVLGDHGAFVNWMQFSHDGSVLASGSGSSAVLKVWSVPDRKLKHTFKFEEPVLASSTKGSQMLCTLSKDGRRLAAVSALIIPVGISQTSVAATLTVWDTGSGKALWSVTNCGVGAFTFSPDGSSLIAYARKVIWEQSGGFHSSRVTEEHLTAWDTESGQVRFTTPSPGLNPSHLLAANHTNAFLTLSGNTNVWFDSKTGAWTKPQPINLIRTLHLAAINPADDRLFVIDFSVENVQFIRLPEGTGIPVAGLKGYTNRVMFASVSSDLKRLAGTQSGRPIVLDLPEVP